jgi:hypothetical protein
MRRRLQIIKAATRRGTHEPIGLPPLKRKGPRRSTRSS